MKATTKIKTKLNNVDETIATVRSLFGAYADTVKVLVSEKKWNDTFGAPRKMECSGVPVEFAEVSEAEIVLSIECEAEHIQKHEKDEQAAKAAKK